MSDKSKIEWCDASWNPIRGCSVVSEGCRNCYAMQVAARFSGEGLPYEGLAYRNSSGAHWTGKVRLIEEHLEDPLRWKRPRRIFVNSMSDLFHEDVSDFDIQRIFDVMYNAPQHTFQILTKRPERMRKLLTSKAWWWAWEHIWLGVSVEDQKTADERIPLLLGTPAAVRWLSCEPLLGAIDLTAIPRTRAEGFMRPLDGRFNTIDWVVVGGESGPHARPMHPDWARSIRDQCVNTHVPFFFKQWGVWSPTAAEPKCGEYTGGGIFLRPDGSYGNQGDWWEGRAAAMDKLTKKAAGRMLDGRTWDEFPEVKP